MVTLYPYELGMMYGTFAAIAAFTIRECSSGGVFPARVIMRKSCPRRATSRAVPEVKSTWDTVTPSGNVDVLSVRTIAVILCFPAAKRARITREARLPAA